MNFIILIFLLLVSLVILFKSVSEIISVFYGVPYVAFSNKDLKQIFEPVKFHPNEVFYDLGCGSGKLLKIVSKKFLVKGIGIEASPFYYLLSKFNNLSNKNVQIKYKNMFDENLSQANIVFCYLVPKMMKKLSTKFSRELKPGTRVISYGFAIPNIKPYQINESTNRHIYFYQY